MASFMKYQIYIVHERVHDLIRIQGIIHQNKLSTPEEENNKDHYIGIKPCRINPRVYIKQGVFDSQKQVLICYVFI